MHQPSGKVGVTDRKDLRRRERLNCRSVEERKTGSNDSHMRKSLIKQLDEPPKCRNGESFLSPDFSEVMDNSEEY